MAKKSKKKWLINILLLLLALLLLIIPFIMNPSSNFSGSDSQAVDLIKKMKPDFKPWFKPLWTPPGAEVESFLFALQAAIGTGFIGYFFGYYVGKNRKAESREE